MNYSITRYLLSIIVTFYNNNLNPTYIISRDMEYLRNSLDETKVNYDLIVNLRQAVTGYIN